MVSDALVTEIKEEMIADGNDVVDVVQKYRSCPIRVNSLRNSLRASIASKRGSLTSNELLFVEAMLEEPLEESELENMDEVLRCDRTFFHDVPKEITETEDSDTFPESLPYDKFDPERKVSADAVLLRSVTSQLGSKKRQMSLDIRRRFSVQQAQRRRAKSLWKKASSAGHMLMLLSKAKKTAGEETAAGEVEANDENEAEENLPTTPRKTDERKTTRRPVLLKQASLGEGIEISFDEDDFDDNKEEKKRDDDDDDDDEEEEDHEDQVRPMAVTSTPTNRGREGFRRASTNIYGGKGFEVADAELFEEIYDGDDHKAYELYDPWLFQEIDRTGKPREFTILGTNHDDTECHPHVLYPLQMDCLQSFLPDTKKGQSFWLKYSLVRDGASTISFLKQVRASPYTLLAIETVDGDVFGGFFSNAWTVQSGYFGTGESFLWRMKTTRKVLGIDSEVDPPSSSSNLDEGSLLEQIERESDLEVFPSEIYYANNYFQLCGQDKIAAGGGTASVPQDFGGDDRTYAPHEIGFGIHLGGDGCLLQGSSAASLTYRNPPLAVSHADGSAFEVLNMEAWGFTPCQTEEDARVLEYKNMFFKKHSAMSSSGSLGA